jgi:hypothetical protein
VEVLLVGQGEQNTLAVGCDQTVQIASVHVIP